MVAEVILIFNDGVDILAVQLKQNTNFQLKVTTLSQC